MYPTQQPYQTKNPLSEIHRPPVDIFAQIPANATSPSAGRELSSLFFACVKLPYSLFPPPWMAGACIRVVHIRIVAFRGRIIVIVQWQSSSPVQGWILSSNNAKQQMRKNKGDDVSIHLLAVIPGAKCEEREREKMQECTYIPPDGWR